MSSSGSVGEAAGSGRRLLLDLVFDSRALDLLRSEVLALAGRVGLPGDQGRDVVLAVHELAANVISHGGGKGRLRAWCLAEAMHCQVDDGDLMASPDPAPQLDPLPEQPGHGLWVARMIAKQMHTMSGRRGTRVTLIFTLPALGETP
jgi:anti-sigma regulatory factor (Ser/Thr protein kinase)